MSVWVAIGKSHIIDFSHGDITDGNLFWQRPGQPDELAPAYVFLASNDSSYMAGQVLHLNGGDVVNG